MTTGQIITLVIIIVVLVLGCAIAGLIALLVPALGKARTTAKGLKSQTQIREVLTSAIIYQAEFGDEEEPVFAIPVDLLLAGNYFGPDLLVSPFSSGMMMSQDYWVMPDAVDETSITDPSLFVVMYDQVMAQHENLVAVGFLDTGTNLMDYEAFESLLAAPPNDERDFSLPPRR